MVYCVELVTLGEYTKLFKTLLLVSVSLHIDIIQMKNS